MKIGNIMVEQVTRNADVVCGYDVSLSPNEIFNILKECFPGLEVVKKTPKIYMGEYRGRKYVIRCKNVTYLGIPHPHFKKRIQIPTDLIEFYKFACEHNAEPLLLGIYAFDNNILFVDFAINTYIQKAAHNSSAHISVEDIQSATESGYFQKTDCFGNTITAFKPELINMVLSEKLGFIGIQHNIQSGSSNIPFEIQNNNRVHDINRLVTYEQYFRNAVVPNIERFFQQQNKMWHGIDCYKKMINSNFKNKYQPEWVGFFLEYEFGNYIERNRLSNMIEYYQDKKSGGIDLDLYFPQIDTFGDLKAHSSNSNGIQGNDWETVMSILNTPNKNNHIYYIVCEHDTEKDCNYDFEVTRFWNQSQNKSNIMSYHSRMKNRVYLKTAYVLDINNMNKQYLSLFKQGINSNGKPRAPKIMIEQKYLENFILHRIEL